jgi:hypothetical protein
MANSISIEVAEIRVSETPVEFPAVLFCFPLETKGSFLTLWIYPADVLPLLQVAGYTVKSPEAQAPASGGPTQNSFNEDVRASLLTTLSILLEAKLVTREAYERKLIANRAVVDRYTQRDQQEVEALLKAVPESSILDQLRPPEG